MASLIGAHFSRNGIKQFPARVVLSMYGNGIGGDETTADTIVILRDTRIFPSGEAPPDFHTFDPETSGVTWAEYGRYWHSERTEQTVPTTGGPGFRNFKEAWDANQPADYYTICNEQGGGEGPEDEIRANLTQLVKIERAISQAANADGRKCCLLNLAGGSPGNFELWKEIVAPFIVESWQNGGNIYGRHVYADDFVDAQGNVKTGQPQRVIDELEYLQSIGYGGGVVLTECGLDGGYGIAGLDRFTFQIQAWEAALRPYADILIGFCWWECGDTGFHADYTEHLKTLIPYMNNSYLGRWEPPTTQPPDGGEGEPVTKITSTVFGGIAGLSDKTITKIRYQYEVSNGSGPNTFSQEFEIPMPPDGTDLRGVRIRAYYEHGRPPIEIETENPNPPDPQQPPDLPYLDVYPLSQRDPVWANVVLGEPTGHGKTIGNWGCLLVAYNMLARYWNITDRFPGAENAHYVSVGAFSAQYIQPAALRTAYPNQVAYDGYLTRDSSAMRPKIREWIDNGWPVACRVDFIPSTAQWDQHWVLVNGYIGDTDFYMADPWHGDIAVVNDRYPIAGSDILEAIFYWPKGETKPPDPPTPPPTGKIIDVVPYFVPDGQYGHKIVMQTGNSTQPMQLEKRANDVILRKGDGNWIDGTKYQDSEQWRVVNGQVQKGIDTSDAGNGGRDGYDLAWAQWIPQIVEVGKTYHSTPTVRRFDRANCGQTTSTGQANDYLYIKALLPTWTSPANADITLNDVLVIEWRSGTADLSVPPNEVYYFAKNIGYCGWGSHFVQEITQGQQPLVGKLDCGM